MKADRKARKAFNNMPPNWKELSERVQQKWQKKIDHAVEVDKENREWLKPLIEEHGWLGRSLVGNDGASAAWLMVQHSDMDLEFQKDCLALMEKMDAGEISLTDLGYLTDRVLCAEGKPQRYGTQLMMVGGELQPSEVEDPENLNKRRAEIGLGTIEEYLKMIGR